MSQKLSSTPPCDLKPGQIWRDNYDYKANGYVRHVKVLAIKGDRVLIHACDTDGYEDAGKPNRYTKASRFNGRRGGFSLVRDT